MFLSRLLAVAGVCICVQLIQGQVFDPTHYGAKGDGKSDDTAAVRAALAAAAANNGGEVLFNKGLTFLTGCFNVTSNVILNVKGKILASQNSDDYVLVEPLPWYGGGQDAQESGKREWHAVIRSYNASNITITGGGLIDGQGAPWWACHAWWALAIHKAPCNGFSRPQLVMLVYTTDVKIYDITFKDSPSWMVHLAWTTNVQAHDVTIVVSDPTAPNTDGFDIDCSVNVLVENVFYNGTDDAVAVKSGMDYNGRTFGRPSANILVRNLTAVRGGGLSIGSEQSAGVRNVTFENCTVSGSAYGIFIKSNRGRGGIVEDITYRNIRVSGVLCCARFTMYWVTFTLPTNVTATPQFRNITIDNFSCSGAQTGYSFEGLPEMYIRDVSLSNIQMQVGNLIEKCENTIGTCNNATVTPSCPPCLQQYYSPSSTVTPSSTTSLQPNYSPSYLLSSGSFRPVFVYLSALAIVSFRTFFI